MEILSDKALAVQASDWVQSFDQCTFSCQKIRKPIYQYRSTRVLEDYLLSGGNEVKKIVDYINTYGDLPAVDKHMTLCEKEGELNRKGRLFTKQTPAIRYYQVTSEKNFKDSVMPYIRYQSMSLRGLELDHKLNALAQLIKHVRHGHKIIYISLDVKKWC